MHVVSRNWVELPERGSRGALRLIRWIALKLGRPAARILLGPICIYFLLTAGPARRASRAYLRRIKQSEPSWLEVLSHFHCYAATILDRVFVLIGQCGRFDLRVHNAEALLAKIDAGQGCLLFGAHVGSFEVMRALGVTERGLPLKVLMNVTHNPVITSISEELNRELAETVIALGSPDAMLQVKESLERGFLVGMLADRVADSKKTVRCRFLGGETDFPAGPIMMAHALRAPVVLFFALYRGSNRYDVHFEVLSERVTLPRAEREREVQAWTQRYASRLEHYVRSAPYNWFNFYDFWT